MSRCAAPMLFALVFLSPVYGQEQGKPKPEPQAPKPKLAEVYVDDARNPGYVQVDGVWEPDNPTKQNEVMPSVVQIKCYRHGGREFAGSDPFCVVAVATPVAGTIHVESNWFKVVEWNTQRSSWWTTRLTA